MTANASRCTATTIAPASRWKATCKTDHFVFNFVTLKRLMRTLVDQLDHRTLLPESNPHFRITRDNGEVTVDVENRRYVLPESDVLILPMSNTTAEKLAEYLAGQLRAKIGDTRQSDRLRNGSQRSGRPVGDLSRGVAMTRVYLATRLESGRSLRALDRSLRSLAGLCRDRCDLVDL